MSWIWNAKLEVGKQFDNLGRERTETKLFHIRIENNSIIEIVEASTLEARHDGFDAKGKLMLPAFKEMHNHLDKTYLSLDWKASIPAKNLEHRLEMEATELEELAVTVEQRASAMIERHLSNGVNYIRTHVNIDPYIQLANLKGVKKALDKYEDVLDYDIVAFPQHGLLGHPEMPDLLRQSFSEGATILGALDPGGIDKDIEKSLQLTMDLAQELNVDVDMHLHDRGYLGFYTMEQWLNMVESQNYKGKTSFSHAFGLANLDTNTITSFAKRLNEHNVKILSTVPISLKSVLIPIDLLQSNGVSVGLGCDGYYDSWSSYGSGDVLEKVKHFCDYTGKTSESSLRMSLGLITQGITPLDYNGTYLWPKVGDLAEFVFVDAESSAEAVAQNKNHNARVLYKE